MSCGSSNVEPLNVGAFSGYFFACIANVAKSAETMVYKLQLVVANMLGAKVINNRFWAFDKN